jgi:hypothetical protein
MKCPQTPPTKPTPPPPEELHKILYDAFTELGEDKEESSVAFAEAAQAEVVNQESEAGDDGLESC